MAKPCPTTGKQKYQSAMAVYATYVRGRARRMTRAYKCPFCGYWHATSQSKRGIA